MREPVWLPVSELSLDSHFLPSHPPRCCCDAADGVPLSPIPVKRTIGTHAFSVKSTKTSFVSLAPAASLTLTFSGTFPTQSPSSYQCKILVNSLELLNNQSLLEGYTVSHFFDVTLPT